MLSSDRERCWAEIDLDAVGHNVNEIRALMGQTKIMGIVKADAYGHGDAACAWALKENGVDYFGVACLDEGEHLRQAGIDDPILILGYTSPALIERLADGHFTQSFLSLPYARELSALAREKNLTIEGHIKVDTGMNRTGILYQDGAKDWDSFVEVFGLPNLKVTGMFSHFPVSDELEQESMDFTRHQIELFSELTDRLQKAGFDTGLRHIQNSYGILNYGDLGFDYCRPGLLYMGVTSDDAIPILSSPDFVPILTWKTKVSMVKDIEDGATVSYGRHYKAVGKRRIASLCAGYADGLPRSCSGKDLKVLVNGMEAPIVGNICMDQCMIDVTGRDDVVPGMEVVLVGRQDEAVASVDSISRKAQTINNETLTRLTSRVPRCYTGDMAQKLAKSHPEAFKS